MPLVGRMTENDVKSHVVKMMPNVRRRLMTHARAFTMMGMRLLGTTLMAFEG
jgi:hypothetical protein